MRQFILQNNNMVFETLVCNDTFLNYCFSWISDREMSGSKTPILTITLKFKQSPEEWH